MTTFNNLYQLSTLIVGVECLVMTITILTLGFKKINPQKSGILSIVFFALAMSAMSVINLVEFILGVQNDINNKLAIVIFAATIELFLFTFAYLAILDDRYVSKKTIIIEVLLIIIFTIPPMCIDSQQYSKLVNILFYIALTFYFGKLILNIVIYKKSLNTATRKLQNYYGKESSNMLKWTTNSFFIVLTIGVASTVVTILNIEVLLTYKTFVIVAYMYLYVLIIRNIYTFITKTDSIDAPGDTLNREDTEQILDGNDNRNGIIYSKNSNLINEDKYIQWINKRMYTRAGISAEETASVLCINRSKLSQYLKNELNTNFYDWIAMLRIEDAKKQLIQKPDKLISDIAIDVGIEDKSNFTRTFKKITGFSPQIYRSLFLNQNSN